jgi:GNAT superfamily N-acetyltransferase
MPITFRPGTIDDSRTVFDIFAQAITDLGQRLGVMAITGGDDPDVLAQFWERRRSLFEHLARSAEHFWLAESDGQAVGYARSIVRDSLHELTEFFVRPGQQSSGVGRELLARAFPAQGAQRRSIVATTDMRAQARYLKLGVYPRFPIVYFSRAPEVVDAPTDLTVEPISVSPENLETLATIDAAVLGHRRDVDHAWLLTDRQGYVYRRNGQPVGYGYVGQGSGPFALLSDSDYPAVLAHAETQAAAHERNFGVEAPLINRAAVDYLLSRGYQMDQFIALFMCDEPFGRFENYLCTSPPFFL